MISQLDTVLVHAPVQRFDDVVAGIAAWLGAVVARYAFDVRLFHPFLSAGLSRRTELFERYPWILGAEYSQAFRHERLDDRSIPDFLGKRARDSRHDIIEIKRPFEELARQDGSPNVTCLDAMAQCERYLDFARTQVAYCASRNLHFDAPRCTLIIGHDVDASIQDEFKRKQRVTPGLHILTYNDLVRYVSETITLVKGLRDGALVGEPTIEDVVPSRQVVTAV